MVECNACENDTTLHLIGKALIMLLHYGNGASCFGEGAAEVDKLVRSQIKS